MMTKVASITTLMYTLFFFLFSFISLSFNVLSPHTFPLLKQVTYNDTNGIEHVKGFSIAGADAISYGWTVCIKWRQRGEVEK